MAAAMTNPDVLIPERLTGTLELPALAGIGSVAQHAYVALRQAILAMDAYDLDADLRLDEKRLAAELGVSRTPVREALSRLQSEGLVEIIPRRGVRVVRKSKAEIVETIIAWAALESMAARLACERADDAQLASLNTLFAGFEQEELRSHLDEYSAANLRFHQRIIELGDSQLIATMADGLLVHVRAIRRHTIGEGDRPERSIVDHAHIIDALQSRQADLAERLVREHALNLARHVQQNWPLD
ncbi:MAG: GntR family transcriptional regulator [Solirubrobacteraceae bacterium]